MIGRLFNRVTWRAFVSAAALLLGVSLISYQAARIGIDGHSPFRTPTARAWLIVALFALWALFYGLLWLVRAIGRMRIVWQAPPEPKVKVRAHLAAKHDQTQARRASKAARMRVTRSVAAALQIVRRGGPMWRLGRHSVYRLPWYLVIGVRASGKTALLDASRLKFTHDGTLAPALDAITPQRWWFADEAVLLEASPPSDGDRPAWNALLNMLKRVRRRRAVNGAIVAISARTLLDGSDTERTACATALRDGIGDMHRCFSTRFPVYVVVTHCDVLAGFDAFFDDLPQEDLAQVWGITFPVVGDEDVPTDAPLSTFPDEFGSLVRQLHTRLIERMPARSDPARSAEIYAFAPRFSALGEPLERLMSDAFGASPYAPQALLRGVYFTAAPNGAMEGGPGSLRGRRGHFITRLLREVVFCEAGLASTRFGWAGKRVALRRAAAIGIALVAIVLGAAMFVSYERNVALIARTARASAELATLAGRGIAAHDPLSMLPLLDAARNLPGGYAQQGAPVPFLARLGLYQGSSLGAIALTQYRALLRETVQPFTADRATDALRTGALEPSKRYALLQTYLMLGEPSHYDAATVLGWVTGDADGLTLTSAQRADWLGHASALFVPNHVANTRLDTSLVAQTRVALATQPLGERIFESIRPRLEAAMPQALSVAHMAGVDAPLVMRRKSARLLSEGVPGAYTLEGYRRYGGLRDTALAHAANEDWVTGDGGRLVDPTARAALKAEVDRVYFSRYIAAWDALLGDVALLPLPRSEESARLVKLLAGADSPLRLFLRAAATQTTLTKADEATPADAAASSGTLATLERRAHALFGNANAAKANGNDVAVSKAVQSSRDAASAQTLVDVHFEALHRLVTSSPGGGPTSLETVQQQLKEAAVYLDAVNTAHARGLPAPTSDALDRLKAAAQGLPVPLGSMLEGLSDNGVSLTLSGERARLNNLWRANVMPFCHAALDGRYPLDPKSSMDVTLDDFARVFGPGGSMDAFFQSNLQQYVDTATNPWTWRAEASNLHMPPDVLRQFKRAAQIRDAFFPGGGKALSVRFALAPLSMDSALTRFVLRVNGQTLDYAHDPRRATSFAWPQDDTAQMVRIDYEPASANGRSGVQTGGPWALFRLLDQARLQAKQSDRFDVNFDLSGKVVVLELDAASVENPFMLPALREFRCLDQL